MTKRTETIALITVLQVVFFVVCQFFLFTNKALWVNIILSMGITVFVFLFCRKILEYIFEAVLEIIFRI